jgi:sugar/nucleoside kinase (ribokinase family)
MTGIGEKQPLLIVGSLAFDSVTTPRAQVDKALGGSASYASIAASYYSSPQVVGVVGDDFEDRHMSRFHTHSVDTEGIERVEGKTFHWKGRYHDNFKERDTLETALNVFEAFDPDVPESYRSSRHLFLGNIDPGLQLKVLEQTHGAEFVAMDTMNFWIDTRRDALAEVLERVDLLFINDEEAAMLSGEGSVLGAAEKILAMGPKYVVIKRGEYGAVLFGPDMTLFVPAVLLPEVVVPTGAGDTFAGGFLGYLSRRSSLDRGTFAGALIAGTVMASFSVEAFSVDGICQLPGERIEERQAQLEGMIRI